MSLSINIYVYIVYMYVSINKYIRVCICMCEWIAHFLHSNTCVIVEDIEEHDENLKLQTLFMDVSSCVYIYIII